MKPSKPQILLVDGYNIIFSWAQLKSIAKQSLDDARVQLTHILSDYQGATQTTVILVFDAHKVKGHGGRTLCAAGVATVFTKEAQTADNYIEHVSSQLAKEAHVTVATSDFLKQIIVISQGASRLSAQGLLDEVNRVKEAVRQKHKRQPQENRNLLMDHMDAKTAQLLEQMRRQTKDKGE